ncbi:MAG: hypothetical protein IKL89_05630 [Clostridia bacterium]|nr:hypothetical protein [Clostridia bacterium]
MNLFIFHAKRRWYVLIPGALVMLLYLAVQPWEPNVDILTSVEIPLALVFGVFCSFTLTSPAEIELCQYRGFPPSRILTAQILPIYLAGAVSISITLARYRFADPVTTNQRLAYILTPFVTVAFFVAASAFIRVLIRNSYATVFFDVLLLFLPLYAMHAQFASVMGWVPEMFFDPALSAYLFHKQWDVTLLRFCINRGIFLALAVLFYLAACWLCDRRSFEDFK